MTYRMMDKYGPTNRHPFRMLIHEITPRQGYGFGVFDNVPMGAIAGRSGRLVAEADGRATDWVKRPQVGQKAFVYIKWERTAV